MIHVTTVINSTGNVQAGRERTPPAASFRAIARPRSKRAKDGTIIIRQEVLRLSDDDRSLPLCC
ncbi:MAG TPA: hypothetical protein VKV40_04140 [Ktedonobacteraceae bacterium]|nr:hypothetical protein [Ktedonobacteraceae bacterium]